MWLYRAIMSILMLIVIGEFSRSPLWTYPFHLCPLDDYDYPTILIDAFMLIYLLDLYSFRGIYIDSYS